MARRVLLAMLTLAMLIVPSAPAAAQDAVPVDVTVIWLNPSENSGVSGVAWIYPLVDSSQVVVTTLIWGLEPNSAHSNHIHRGSCENQGGIVYNLTDLVANDAGYATSSTLVSAPLGALMAESYYVNVHTGILGTSPSAAPGITCGNIQAMMM
jgi:hypothetical protein